VKKIYALLFLLLGVATVFVILATVQLPSHTYLWREVHNTGHTPLFGALAIFVLGIFRIQFDRPGKSRLRLYFWAAAIAIGMGGVMEIAQVRGPGDADVFDLLRDIAGIISFTLIFAVFDRKLELWRRKSGSKLRAAIIVFAISLLLSAILPVGLWAAAYAERESRFPTLLDFDSTLAMKFARTQDARLELQNAPQGWSSASGRIGKVTFLPGQYPGVAISEVFPDWRNYRALKFDVYSELAGPVKLCLRVDDIYHDNSFEDRYNTVMAVNPGNNAFEISLEDIRRAPQTRRMNMGGVRSIVFFVNNRESQFSMYFDNFRLE
jgi:hypothetical protein